MGWIRALGALGATLGANPLALKAIAALVVAASVAIGGVLIWGLTWKARALESAATAVALEAQAKTLAEATRACSAGVEAAKRAGDSAVRSGAALLAEARRLNRNVPAVVSELRDLMKTPIRPDGTRKDCTDAWAEIERTEQKAGRAPR